MDSDHSGLMKIVKNKDDVLKLILDEKNRESFDDIDDESAAEVRSLLFEIREIQETNFMLTKQALDYSQQVIGIVQAGIKASSQTYGKKGYVNSNASAKTTLDKSI